MVGKRKITCNLCKHWYEVPIENRSFSQNERSIFVHTRSCSFINSDVFGTSSACHNFVLTNFFWCSKCDNYLSIKVCVHRSSNKKEGCSRCKQGLAIRNLVKEDNKMKSLKGEIINVYS
jgi:hypothetical protein